jgi:HEXXH motif-containing protein
MLPLLGSAAAVGGGGATVRSTASGAAVLSALGQVDVPADPHQVAPGWQALRHLRAGSFEVLLDDLDPFRMPATSDVAPRLGAADLDRWDAAFRDAWSLLTLHHPEVAAEVVGAIRVIVPLIVPPRGQVGSSSAENFGAIALSESPDPRAFAVTLAHEVQHLKLSALLDIVSLTRPDEERRFYAPWRDDPRPASGLLQGAYAYLGVSGFWRRQRDLDHGAARIRAHAEFARWREAAASVVETLRSSGLLTPAGLEFVEGMARTLSPWQHEPVPAQALALARREAEQHLADWRTANGPVRA